MPEFLRDDNESMASIVMAIGVGGGGGNAINHLYTYGDKNVSFMLCNTDKQALRNSPIPDDYKVQLGSDGLGAGNDASSGRKLAEESADKIKEALVSSGIKMAFVVAGMGGGTGTGAAPVVARISKELGILTIGVVTIPFVEEGRPRIMQAIEGVDELSKNVDSLIIINNAHIVEMYGDLSMSKAFFQSNEIISKAVKSIANIIDTHFIVNVDFADVCKVMRNSGVALMGTGVAEGEDRAIRATEEALTSPLLHNQDIKGAKNVLVCMLSSEKNELRMSDSYKVPKYIQERTKTKNETDVIWGAGYDDSLEDKLQVDIIATGFDVQNIPAMKDYYSKSMGGGFLDDKDKKGNDDGPTKVTLEPDEGENASKSQTKISFEDYENQVPGGRESYSTTNVNQDNDEIFVVTPRQGVSNGTYDSQQSSNRINFEDDSLYEDNTGSLEQVETENITYQDEPEFPRKKIKKEKKTVFLGGFKTKVNKIINDVIAKDDEPI